MKNLMQAWLRVMQDTSHVEKKGRNEFHKYDYATEGDAIEHVRPVLLKHGIVVIPSVVFVSPIDEQGNTTVEVDYLLCHAESGESYTVKAAGCGNDKNSKGIGDKGLYKALTGANKYFILKSLMLATGDDPERDDDKPSPAQRDPFSVEPERKKSEPEPDDTPDRILPFVEMGVKQCGNTAELGRFWDQNVKQYERIGVKYPEAYEKIKAMFKLKNQELSSLQ